MPRPARALAATLAAVSTAAALVALPRPASAAPAEVVRLAGPGRVETAVAVARDLFPAPTAPAAVVARADAFADALAGVPLAAAVGGPLLLSSRDNLSDATARALEATTGRGGVVYLLGGTEALRPAVEAAVAGRGYVPVRLAGEDRYATAAAIASRLPAGDDVFVASGAAPADALAAAAVAGARAAPLLLTAKGSVPPATADALDAGDRVVVVGGPAVVAPAVETALAARVSEVRRVHGADRYATAAAVAVLARPERPRIGVAQGHAWPDALTGARHAASTGAPLLLTRRFDVPAATASATAGRAPDEVVVYGGAAVVHPTVEDALRDAAVADPGAPFADPPPGGRTVRPGEAVVIPFDRAVATVSARASTSGGEVPASVAVEGGRGVLRLGPGPAPGAYAVTVTLDAVGPDGAASRTRFPLTLVVPPPTTRSPEGFTVAGGSSPAVGFAGPLRRYTVEVEPATGVGVDEAVRVVEDALHEPRRGWTSLAVTRFQRIGDAGAADFRIVVATPATVDRFCARVGLNTAGIYSCWDGRRAMLNSTRFTRGAATYGADLVGYRRYLVNHEVGHALRYGHRGCPAPGALAPVMTQQTKSLYGCVRNPWPNP